MKMKAHLKISMIIGYTVIASILIFAIGMVLMYLFPIAGDISDYFFNMYSRSEFEEAIFSMLKIWGWFTIVAGVMSSVFFYDYGKRDKSADYLKDPIRKKDMSNIYLSRDEYNRQRNKYIKSNMSFNDYKNWYNRVYIIIDGDSIKLSEYVNEPGDWVEKQ